ncbi:MAG: exodeoxyribonuclease V subunit alpha [Rhodanobacter sp.]
MSVSGVAYHFRPLPIDLMAPEPWRSLDRTVARWVVIHGGSPLLALVAGWASLAEGHGDSALPLGGAESAGAGMGALDADALNALEAEPMVCVIGTGPVPRADTPFVIDRGHFYLRRNFLHEVAVAAHVDARRAARFPAGHASAADLGDLFQGATGADVQAQRNAVAAVLGRRLFVLTGGPGTGKTSTVLRMLLMLIKDAAERAAPVPSIRLAAPTGKAAQRLAAALRDGARRFRDGADVRLPASWHACLEQALTADAGTLHRVLGSRGRSGGFRHHADNPLPADIVVVDEASMVDLALLRALLDALRDDATLILVGDADQLTSVGTGSVLLDLVGALEANGAPELVRLQHSFRAQQALVAINHSILQGDAAGFADAWQAAGASAIRHEVATAQELRRALRRWCCELQKSLQASGAFEVVPAGRDDLVLAALDGLRQHQLLCALRESEFGSTVVNAAIERTLSGCVDDYAGAPWYPGRAVMITRNDAAAGLFNGDIGICLLGTDGQLRVWFEAVMTSSADDQPVASASAAPGSQRSVRALAPGQLPDHEGGFALTIHKSQGSEYDHVALLLPPDADNRILSRQLLYTGASRARRVIELWATDAALETAIATPVRRAGGLRSRLRTGLLVRP